MAMIVNGRGYVGIGRSNPNRFDPDAQTFITAANITNTTQQTAINTLVLSLKSNGIWTKMKAIYPFVGGTASSHKFNLKDPRDLDAAFRLTFTAGWTHSSTGALPNGTSDYANTNLNSQSHLQLNSAHISYYSRTNNASTMVMAGTQTLYILGRWTNYHANNSVETNTVINMGNTTDGFFMSNRIIGSVMKIHINNSIQTDSTSTAANATVQSNKFIPIGCQNSDFSGLRFYNNYSTAFATIGDGLTDTEASNFYTAVQTYQTTLGRQVGVPIVSDSDAQAFLNAAVITGTTEANAVNTLVTSLKSAGVWTKMKAIYPMVGGTASSHKFNLKDPRDLDAAFRLSFTAGWIHSSTGALPNGTSDYANTYLTPSTVLAQNSRHISSYIRTPLNKCLIGSAIGGYNQIYLDAGALYNILSSTSYISYPTIANNGMYLTSRISSTTSTSYRNGSFLFNDNITSNSLGTANLTIAARDGSGSSSSQTSFVTIGDGLTDTEASNLYTAVQTYQTSLGRQV